jgi:hypothetical protein
METIKIDHTGLYRLPWTLPDNGISWLKPTAECNLTCDGCYRVNEADSHKSFDEVLHELDFFQRLRNSDCMSIAGGDPLLYPDIVPLVAEIKKRGMKPIINTNGKALTPELLKSNQGRDDECAGKNELELNDLRLHYAKMLAEYGDISCSFNSTVYTENLHHIPGMVQWAQKHIDIVHTMVFICFRHVVPDMPVDWYAHAKKVDTGSIWYSSYTSRRVDIGSMDLVTAVREVDPDFTPAAYLNGTEDPSAFKWLLSERMGTKDRIYGYVGPKFLELLMAAYHFAKNRYLSYTSPKAMKKGRSALFLVWPFDRGLRKTWGNYFRALLRNPFRILQPVYLQSIMFIQPVDLMEDGAHSMCDGCPDMTVHEGKLVWSCRLEELKTFGTFLQSVPKDRDQRTDVRGQ